MTISETGNQAVVLHGGTGIGSDWRSPGHPAREGADPDADCADARSERQRALDKKVANLTDAIEGGAAVAPLVAKVQARPTERDELLAARDRNREGNGDLVRQGRACEPTGQVRTEVAALDRRHQIIDRLKMLSAYFCERRQCVGRKITQL